MALTEQEREQINSYEFSPDERQGIEHLRNKYGEVAGDKFALKLMLSHPQKAVKPGEPIGLTETGRPAEIGSAKPFPAPKPEKTYGFFPEPEPARDIPLQQQIDTYNLTKSPIAVAAAAAAATPPKKPVAPQKSIILPREPIGEGAIDKAYGEAYRENVEKRIQMGVPEDIAKKEVTAELQQEFVRRSGWPYASTELYSAKKQPTGGEAFVEALKPQIIVPEEYRTGTKELELLNRDETEKLRDQWKNEFETGRQGRFENYKEYEKYQAQNLFTKTKDDIALRSTKDDFKQEMNYEPTDEDYDDYISAKAYRDFKYMYPQLYDVVATPTERIKTFGLELLSKALTNVEGGAVVETPVAAVMRDLGSAMVLVTDPLARMFTYDVDEEGNVVDPEDVAYKIDKYVTETTGYSTEDIQKALGKPQEYAKSLGRLSNVVSPLSTLPLLAPVPFQASKRTVSEIPAGSTGTYWGDVAVGIKRGRFQGNEYTEVPAYQEAWAAGGHPSGPWLVGMGTELAVPGITPLKPGMMVAKGVAKGAARVAAKGVAKGTAKRLGAASKLVEGSKVAKGLKEGLVKGLEKAGKVATDISAPVGAIERFWIIKSANELMQEEPSLSKLFSENWKYVGESPHTVRSAYSKVVADNIAAAEIVDDFYKTGGLLSEKVRPLVKTSIGKAIVAKILKDGPEAARDPAFLKKLTGKILDMVDASKATDKNMGRMAAIFDSFKNAYDGVYDAMSGEYLRARVAVASVKNPNVVKKVIDISKNASLSRAEKVKNIIEITPLSDQTEYEVLAEALRPVVMERFANKLPSDYIFVTPTLIVSDKVVKQVLKEGLVVPAVRKIMQVENVGNQFKLVAGTEVNKILVEELGQKVATSKYWSSVIAKIDSGEVITGDEYMNIYNVVLANKFKKLGLGAAEVKFETPSIQQMRVPVARRAEGLRVAETLLGGKAPAGKAGVLSYVKAGINKARKLLETEPVSVYVEGTPIEIRNAVESINGKMANTVDAFTDVVKASRKANESPEQAFQNILNHTIETGSPLTYVPKAAPKTIGEPAGIRGTDTSLNTWTEVLNLYYGGASLYLDEIQIRKAIGGRQLTPNTLAAVVSELEEINASLAGRGAKTPSPLYTGGEAAYTEILTAWMINKAQETTVREGLTELAEATDILVDIRNPIKGSRLPSAAKAQKTFEEKGGVRVKDLAWGAEGLKNAFNSKLSKKYGFHGNDVYNILVHMDAASPGLKKQFIQDFLIAQTIDTGAVRWNAPLWDSITNADSFKTLFKSEEVDRIIEELTAKGKAVTKEDIYDDLFKAIKPEVEQAGTAMSSYGLVSPQNMQAYIAGFKPILEHIDEETYALLPIDVRGVIKELQEASSSGTLQHSLSRYFLQDKGRASWIGDWMSSMRRVTTSGILGGGVLPNGRYLGMNIITAPLIIYITTDAKTAVKSVLPFGAPGVSRSFIDKFGKVWTDEMVDAAMARNNITFSQATYEFSDVVIKDIQRVARLNSKGEGVNIVRTGLHNLDLRNKTLWDRVAEQSDMYFRKNVFVSALAEGKTEEEAALLARKSLLDYGAIPPAERNFTAKATLFYAFRRQMTLETLRSLAKAPEKAVKLIKFQKQQEEQAGAWLFSEDYVKSRLWARMRGDLDFKDVYEFGPSVPSTEVFMDAVNVVAFFLDTYLKGDYGTAVGKITETVMEEAFSPGLELVKELYTYRSAPEAKDGGIVPPELVNTAMRTGGWNAFVKLFHVETVPEDQRRQGIATFNDVQYRFRDKEGWQRFMLAQYLLFKVGMMRNITDYSKIALGSGAFAIDNVKVEAKEHKTMDTAKGIADFSTSVSTPILIGSEQDLRNRVEYKILREFRELGKEK